MAGTDGGWQTVIWPCAAAATPEILMLPMTAGDPQEALHCLFLNNARRAEINGEIDAVDCRIQALFLQQAELHRRRGKMQRMPPST